MKILSSYNWQIDLKTSFHALFYENKNILCTQSLLLLYLKYTFIYKKVGQFSLKESWNSTLTSILLVHWYVYTYYIKYT